MKTKLFIFLGKVLGFRNTGGQGTIKGFKLIFEKWKKTYNKVGRKKNVEVYSKLCHISPDLGESYYTSLYVLKGMGKSELGNWHRNRINYLESLVKEVNVDE